MGVRIVTGLLLAAVVALVPATAPAQEIHFGFFDAGVDVEGVGGNNYPGFSIGGSMPVTQAFPVRVYVRYNRDYGSEQKLTDYVVPSLQVGAAVRVVKARSLSVSLRLGVIRAYLKEDTVNTRTIGTGVTLGERYGLAGSLDYGTKDGVTTLAFMAGAYFRF